MDISIKKTIYVANQEIILFKLQNAQGAYIEIMNYGATITSIVIPDKKGQLSNMVLCYNEPEDYLLDTFYLNSTIGRFANRISNACFTFSGKTYRLDKNDGKHTNHGGFNGFNKKTFDYHIHPDKLELSIRSHHGEGGFPGELYLQVFYRFSEQNELFIEYSAVSDQETPVNFTNHTYFNLGTNRQSALKHRLRIISDQYLEMSDDFLPTGKIISVEGTFFDFREYRRIDESMLAKKDPSLNGYNHYFIKKENGPLVFLWNDETGRQLTVSTSMPGIMFYTGDYLKRPLNPFAGVCFEAHYYPDGLNHSNFNSNILSPGEVKKDWICYRFDCR